MAAKERLINSYILLFLPLGACAVISAIVAFPLEKAGAGLIAFSAVTVFFSSYLRIQLPRTKIHLTISDALIFLAMLYYGGEAAVLIAVLEAGFTSLNFRRQGVAISAKTIVINILIAAISVFLTSLIVDYIFPSTDFVLIDSDLRHFATLLAVMALSHFVINSFCVALMIAAKTEKSVWMVWNEYCLNALVMFIAGALMAGLMAKALQQIDVALFAAVIAFFTVAYLTYRRYVDDVKVTAAKAENAERGRAEQAEAHVNELKHYVAELEKSGDALRESREKFRHAAFHDELTDLPNRNGVLESIRNCLEETRVDSARKFAVLFLDLNRFKTVNDSLGHSIGDRLIKLVAARLVNLADSAQTVGRFSGDEFAIVMPRFADESDVTAFAAKIAGRLAMPFQLDDRQVFTSVSIGIVFSGDGYSDAREILRDTDIAMYKAKEDRKEFAIFDPNMHARAVSLLQIETDLRYAVERNELELYYQPIIDLGKSKLAGFEALVRWNHPKHGLIMPNEFIPVSEDTGLIIPMTLQILRGACVQLVDWQNRYPDHKSLTVSVNISGNHFADPKLVEQIRSILFETAMPPDRLKLEITESAAMENAENTIAKLIEIKKIGVKLSIDDFGTGYSSLSYLHRFPIDTLKVDRSFVCTMEEGSENGEIVRAVIALAKALNLNVIAEGIESIHQLHRLRALGCEYGQGYLFSRPLPVKDIERVLTDRSNWHRIVHEPDFTAGIQENVYSESIFTN